MKRILIRTVVGIAGVMVLGAGACQVNAAELKVGFVNAQQVLEKAPQADAARAQLEKEFAPRDRRLVAEQKTLQQKQEKLARDSTIMSDSERDRLERDILQEKRDLKRARDDFRDDLNMRRNEELADLQKKVVQTIRELAKENKYDLVVTDGVLYASDRVDMTAQVLDRLKKDFDKAGGKKH